MVLRGVLFETIFIAVRLLFRRHLGLCHMSTVRRVGLPVVVCCGGGGGGGENSRILVVVVVVVVVGGGGEKIELCWWG